MRPLLDTLETGLGAGALATALGSTYAWIISRTDVPLKRVLAILPFLTISLPELVKGFAWIFILSPQIGLGNFALMSLFHLTNPPFNIYGGGGIIFVTGLGGSSIAYLIVKPALDSYDSRLEEASRTVGNGSLSTFLRITLPGILPAVLSAFFLLFIDAMALLDYAIILGEPVKFPTLATEIDFWISESIPPKYNLAATIGVEFMAMTVVLVAIYIWLTRKAFRFAVVGGKAPPRTVNKLRKWRYPALAICLVIMTLSFFLPFTVLLFLSFAKSPSFIHGQILTTYWLGNWIGAIHLPIITQAFENSVIFAFAAGILATVIALFLSYAFLRSNFRAARFLEYASYLPLVVPGIVYSVALFWTFLLVPGISNLIYGTIWPLVLAVTFVNLPKTVRMTSTNMIQISNELEESPRVCGLGWWRTFWKIIIPLVKGGILNSFLWTFINSIRELSAVVLLTTSSTVVFDVLLLQLWSSQATSLGIIAAGSAMITIFIAAILLAGEFFAYLQRRRAFIKHEELVQEIRFS